MIMHPVVVHTAYHVMLASAGQKGGVTFNLAPNSSKIPGASALQGILEGLLWFAAGISLVGLLVSAVAMGIGKHSSNGRLHERGREGLLAALVGTVVAGGGAALITWAFNLGQSIK